MEVGAGHDEAEKRQQVDDFLRRVRERRYGSDWRCTVCASFRETTLLNVAPGQAERLYGEDEPLRAAPYCLRCIVRKEGKAKKGNSSFRRYPCFHRGESGFESTRFLSIRCDHEECQLGSKQQGKPQPELYIDTTGVNYLPPGFNRGQWVPGEELLRYYAEERFLDDLILAEAPVAAAPGLAAADQPLPPDQAAAAQAAAPEDAAPAPAPAPAVAAAPEAAAAEAAAPAPAPAPAAAAAAAAPAPVREAAAASAPAPAPAAAAVPEAAVVPEAAAAAAAPAPAPEAHVVRDGEDNVSVYCLPRSVPHCNDLMCLQVHGNLWSPSTLEHDLTSDLVQGEANLILNLENNKSLVMACAPVKSKADVNISGETVSSPPLLFGPIRVEQVIEGMFQNEQATAIQADATLVRFRTDRGIKRERCVTFTRGLPSQCDESQFRIGQGRFCTEPNSMSCEPRRIYYRRKNVTLRLYNQNAWGDVDLARVSMTIKLETGVEWRQVCNRKWEAGDVNRSGERSPPVLLFLGVEVDKWTRDAFKGTHYEANVIRADVLVQRNPSDTNDPQTRLRHQLIFYKNQTLDDKQDYFEKECEGECDGANERRCSAPENDSYDSIGGGESRQRENHDGGGRQRDGASRAAMQGCTRSEQRLISAAAELQEECEREGRYDLILRLERFVSKCDLRFLRHSVLERQHAALLSEVVDKWLGKLLESAGSADGTSSALSTSSKPGTMLGVAQNVVRRVLEALGCDSGDPAEYRDVDADRTGAAVGQMEVDNVLPLPPGPTGAICEEMGDRRPPPADFGGGESHENMMPCDDADDKAHSIVTTAAPLARFGEATASTALSPWRFTGTAHVPAPWRFTALSPWRSTALSPWTQPCSMSEAESVSSPSYERANEEEALLALLPLHQQYSLSGVWYHTADGSSTRVSATPRVKLRRGADDEMGGDTSRQRIDGESTYLDKTQRFECEPRRIWYKDIIALNIKELYPGALDDPYMKQWSQIRIVAESGAEMRALVSETHQDLLSGKRTARTESIDFEREFSEGAIFRKGEEEVMADVLLDNGDGHGGVFGRNCLTLYKTPDSEDVAGNLRGRCFERDVDDWRLMSPPLPPNGVEDVIRKRASSILQLRRRTTAQELANVTVDELWALDCLRKMGYNI